MTLTGLEKARQNDFAKTDGYGNFRAKQARRCTKRSIGQQHVKQWLMRINMTLMTIIFLALQVQAKKTAAQEKITLHVKGASLEAVLELVRKQTGYSYAVQDQYLGAGHPVSISVDGAQIKDVLDAVFRDQPYSYEIVDRIIVVKKKGSEKKLQVRAGPGESAPGAGVVLTESGQPLAGATITIKATGKIILTNEQGEFQLTGIQNKSILTVSYAGYSPKQITISQGEKIEIYLSVAANQLDQVQIIAYGKTTERFNTGNVVSIKAESLEKQPVSNLLAALDGISPGLAITQYSGVPGSAFKVQLRGQNSIASGNDPFYVIDGVPYASQMLPNLNGAAAGLAAIGGNPLNFINISDIESIDILKDADATAIYGSRAANGAVLITTKRGKAGNTAVDLSAYSGIGHVERKFSWLNTPQYLQMRHEALSNDGAMPSLGNGDFDLLSYDTTRYTDWEKALIGGTSRYDDAQGSVSGGNANTQFLIGGGYHRETTVFPADFADQKASVHFSVNNSSKDQKLKVGLQASYTNDNNNSSQDMTSDILQLPPDAPAGYNSDGSLNWANSTWPFIGNPYAGLKIAYKGRTNNLVGSGSISYEIKKGFDVKVNLGYTNMTVNESVATPISFYDPAFGVETGNTGFNTSSLISWIVEPQATYVTHFGKGKFDALAGISFQQTTSQATQLNATGYTNDALLQDIQAAAAITVNSNLNTQYKYNAGFARVSYNYDDKYLINLSGRRDGSSRFGPGKQFANFGAFGLGWIFSKEHFLESALPVVSFGKLRASYGTSGNDQIGDYQYLSNYTPNTFPYQGIPGIYAQNLANPDYAWEVNRKAEAALELGFLKDRILLSGSYYRNRSSNQLVGYALPTITGFSSVEANLPAVVQNTGIEITFSTVNIKTSAFQWSTNFNITIPANKLISFPGLATSSYATQYAIGKPLGIVKVYRWKDVNDSTGVYEFYTNKNEVTYDPTYPDDLTKIIKTDRAFYGGLGNNVRFKGFELDILFNFVRQKGPNFIFNTLPGYIGFNQPKSILRRWQQPGDQTNIQMFSQSFGSVYNGYEYASMSDLAYGDASFIRLKNLSLSWSFPHALLQRMHLQALRFFIHGQNLFLITGYKGRDPEIRSMNTLPPLRVITGGFHIIM